MRLFLVLAHPDPESFNAGLVRAATDAARLSGHDVIVSDLYAMGFNPVLDLAAARQHRGGKMPGAEQALPADVDAELQKLFACDVLVLQFPLWCFGVPAILKGWMERVMVTWPVWGRGKGFASDAFQGKRAMCSVSTGGVESEYSAGGVFGDLRALLHPLEHGLLAASGFTVSNPFVAWAVSRQSAEVRRALQAQGVERILSLLDKPALLGDQA